MKCVNPFLQEKFIRRRREKHLAKSEKKLPFREEQKNEEMRME
jgi:hypothetical protein